MANNYIDPITYLPKHYGEIYSDRNIKLVGKARLQSGNLDLSDVSIICAPIDGGNAAITTIPNALYSMNIGDSIWVNLRRIAGSSSATPIIYPMGLQPKPQENLYQLGYKITATEVLTQAFTISESSFYTILGYGKTVSQYTKIVGASGYPTLTAAAIVDGDNVLITNGYIGGTETIAANDVAITAMPGVAITGVAASPILTLVGDRISINNLRLIIPQTIATAWDIQGSDNNLDAIRLQITGGVTTTAFNIGASSARNYINSSIKLAGGSLTTRVVNAGTDNFWNIRG